MTVAFARLGLDEGAVVRSRRPGTLVALLGAAQGHTPGFLETRGYLYALAGQGAYTPAPGRWGGCWLALAQNFSSEPRIISRCAITSSVGHMTPAQVSL